MFSFICILHSGDGTYSEPLTSNAAYCTTALFQSVKASSPDFVPSVAILRADPVVGSQFLYASNVRDSNHAVAGATLYQAVDQGSSTDLTATVDFAQAFRARSVANVQHCILQGTQRAVTATSRKDPADVWGCLCGALLTALCFAHKHDLCTVEPAAGIAGAAPSSSSAAAAEVMRSPQGVILVFSDCTDPRPWSFSSECALATSTLTIAKCGLTVCCFGQAVSDAQAGSPGGSRLRALAASVNGVCADRFTFPHVGVLLDRCADHRYHGTDNASPSDVTATTRAKRERITEQYVVTPTVLGQQAAPSDARETVSSGSVPEANSAVEAPSDFGWLCPRCMAVVYRDKADTTGANTEEGEEDERAPFCPYCGP